MILFVIEIVNIVLQYIFVIEIVNFVLQFVHPFLQGRRPADLPQRQWSGVLIAREPFRVESSRLDGSLV
jgi:hypothetical protein